MSRPDTPEDAAPPAADGMTAMSLARRRAEAPAGPRALNLQLDPAGTEAEIAAMVDAFYARIRADAELGPIFAAHVDDWDAHLTRLTAFWSSLLRGTTRYSGSPMQTHAALPGLTAELFARWLALFRLTLAELPNRRLAERAERIAGRVARSLWMGYQLNQAPDQPPRELG